MESITIVNRQSKSLRLLPGTDLSSIYENHQSLKAIEWMHESKTYSIADEGTFFCYPVFALNKLGIVWKTHARYKHPANLVIYNADGSIHKIITVPLFISNELKKDAHVDSSKPGFFENLGDLLEIDAKIYLVVNISAGTHHVHWGDCRHIEKRALDLEAGEFHPTWSEGGIYW